MCTVVYIYIYIEERAMYFFYVLPFHKWKYYFTKGFMIEAGVLKPARMAES